MSLELNGRPDEAQRVLYHEAGHAVFAVRRRLLFEFAEVRENDWGEVRCVGGPLDIKDRTFSQEEMACWRQFYAAGAAAERLFYGEYREHGAQRDVTLHETLGLMSIPPRTDDWEESIQAATKVIDRESVAKVAVALNERKKLTDEQVHDFLGCKPPWW
jgi:hypothetical protein